MFSTFTSK
jgi:hypothetical protein